MAAKQPVATSTAAAPDHVSQDDDVKRLRALLDRGIPLDQIVDELAGSLATQVAAQLGIATQTARAQLKAAFSTALSTTGSSGAGPPPTNAQRALTLATRFRQIADLATRVTKADTGTSIRLIAGQRSDADKAGADPTPTPGSTGTPQTAAPVPAPSLVSTPSDGRTVATSPALAVATGGDTLLGRTLARAWLADERRSRVQPADAPAPTAAPTAATSTAPAPAHATVDAFVQAFVTALARADAPTTPAPSTASTGDGGSDAPAPAAAATSSSPAMPFAIAVAHDAAPVVPPAPASTLPQTPQVDPNAVVDQIVRAMQIRTTDGQSDVRLRLVPEHLGDVSIRLTVTDGSVNASIVAHTPDAQNALAGGQAQLAKTLADAGLKLQSFDVGLAGGFAGNRDQSGQQHAAQRQPTTRRIGALAVDDETSDELGLLAAPSFGPPVYTATRSLANYLV